MPGSLDNKKAVEDATSYLIANHDSIMQVPRSSGHFLLMILEIFTLYFCISFIHTDPSRNKASLNQ
jgi:hypothetical protein